ncbi:hypothetical protein QV05_04865 [Gallibacterium genomosp. 1]|uniref:Uncharacterized protein n=1 Tax=Gallibacterium genomosp. 1 TaxID=155515 RepID=A0AB36DWJ1_9PAST|nr:hypothetical protein [Gallibacterium genomosp. 1]OBX01537.1 hypothetical protein QV05_04865 [Gallibacterium genomosp. 1]
MINPKHKEKGFESLNELRELIELAANHAKDDEFNEAVLLLRTAREALIEAEVNFKFVHFV